MLITLTNINTKKKYGDNLPDDEMLNADNPHKHKYKEKYGDNLPDDEMLNADNPHKHKYKEKYGDNLPANEILNADNPHKHKYKEKYGDNLPVDEVLNADNPHKHKYKEKYGDNLPADEILNADNPHKHKYKEKYGDNLPADEILNADNPHKHKYKEKYTHRLGDVDDVKISHEIYDSLYNEFQEENNIVTQQKLFDRISGQNLGDLLVKNWLEQELTIDEQKFLARWESEQVVRIAAMEIYCDQGDGMAAPIDKLRNLLTN